MWRVIFILVCFLSENLVARHRTIALQEALDKKLVSAKASSLGAYQGYCMTLQIKNLSKDSLLVFLEPGRRLNSVNDQFQDILIVKQEIVVLRWNEQKSIKVKGYCCQASNRCPSVGEVYALGTVADSNLVRLAQFLNEGKFESGAEQNAVWAISDKHSASTISSTNDSLTVSLRKFVANLKGERLPWYYILSKRYVYSNGVISIIPLSLKGEINYSNDAESYATLLVTNEWGLPVCEIKSEWIKAASNQSYKVEIPVKGLPKGKYKVELVTKDKQLAKEEFEI